MDQTLLMIQTMMMAMNLLIVKEIIWMKKGVKENRKDEINIFVDVKIGVIINALILHLL